MYIKQKRLMSKCRACGTENMLDDTHRAGTQLMKNLPKDMSEIDTSKKQGEDKKTEEIKDGKSNAERGGRTMRAPAMKIRRRGKRRRRTLLRRKRNLLSRRASSSTLKKSVSYFSIELQILNDEYLVTTPDILNDYKLVLQY